MSLKLYRQKRDFNKTPEPSGNETTIKNYKNIFVVQKHAASHLHYDFRLELNGVLLSWAVPKGPCLDPSIKRLAMHVEDHPVEYATFEGIIPQGEYGGGTVMLWDIGKWTSLDSNPKAAYHAGDMTFELQAEKLHGGWKLVRIKREEKSWLLIKIKDQYAKPLSQYDITKSQPYSVKTDQDLDEIAANYSHMWSKRGLVVAKRSKPSKKLRIKTLQIDLPEARMPKVIYPELATLVTQPPDGNQWLHEIKFDGYRLIVFKDGSTVRLVTRNNNDWTSAFKTIERAIKKLPIERIILDAEIVVLDDQQHSNFQLLQNSIKGTQDRPFLLYVFDLLYYDKYNLMTLPLLQRKEILEKFMQPINNPHLKYSDHVFGSGKEILRKSCALGLEGIVSKNGNREYLQKRSADWLKTKCTKRQEFIIGGFTPPRGSRKYFGSLLLGTYDAKQQLIYNGNVGTGFTTASLKTVYDALKKYITDTLPFNRKPPGSRTATWVKPVLAAEVEFSEWTKDGNIRHPSFKGLRADKPAKSITKEKPIPTETITETKASKKKVRR